MWIGRQTFQASQTETTTMHALLATLLPILLLANGAPDASVAPVALAYEWVAPLPAPTISLNITPNQSMTVTGSGYPPNSTVTITLKNLNNNNSVTVAKTTDGNGVLQPGGNPVGSLTASAGDVIQASTPAPNEATTTATVPPTPRPVNPETIGRVIRFLISLLP